MTDTERLAAIRHRCVMISQQDYRPDTSLPAGQPSVTVAMALSTIAAIDGLRKLVQAIPVGHYLMPCAQGHLDNILSAWKDQ